VLNALVNRQNGEVTRAGQTSGIVERLHVSQHGRRTVVIHHHAVYVVVAGQVELVGWNGHTTML